MDCPLCESGFECEVHDRPILVAVHTDGLGTYQARCMGCSWVGRWYRSEDRATKQAATHTAHSKA